MFVRATKGVFDAVLTMYDNQGQIAMKLIGFDRGVTLLGGFPFPICTPAHGSAYDIAGKGVASLGASKAAVLLAASMGRKGPARAAAQRTSGPQSLPGHLGQDTQVGTECSAIVAARR